MGGNSGKVGIVLQGRDRHLLSEIGLLGDVDREIASEIAPFTSITQSKQRLLELTRAGFLSRYFTGTIQGGRKAIYRLSDKGARQVGLPIKSSTRKLRALVAQDLFLEHRLKINSLYLIAKYRPIPIAGVALLQWRTFTEALSPSCPLIPDAYFEFSIPNGIRAMFAEVDLGTESHEVWARKVERYLQFATSGEFEKVFRQTQFRVLVVTTSERRQEKIRATTAAKVDRIFWFTTFEHITREGFWAAIWRRPVGDQTLALIQ